MQAGRDGPIDVFQRELSIECAHRAFRGEARAAFGVYQPQCAGDDQEQERGECAGGPPNDVAHGFHRSGPIVRWMRMESSLVSVLTGYAKSSRNTPTGDFQRMPRPAPTCR